MTKIIENQSLLDVAIQEDGSVLAVFDWAEANGISVTDDLFPGQVLTAPVSEYRNAEVVEYFKNRGRLIATNYNQGYNAGFETPWGEFPISF